MAKNHSRPDVDISRPTPWYRPGGGCLWLGVGFLAVLLIVLAEPHGSGFFEVMRLVGLTGLIVVGWLAWVLLVRRGLLTWMALALTPARVFSRGDTAKAERLFAKALERARRFAPDDPRRGMMLVELAGYVKNQGRHAEAEALFAESVDILAAHQRTHRTEYFVALNNYAIYFIHLGDFAAAQEMLEKALDLALLQRRTGAGSTALGMLAVRDIEFVLCLNLVFLFLEMRALDEAASQLEQAERMWPGLSRTFRSRFGDHYRAIRALVLFRRGRFADAAGELAQARKADYPAVLAARARLCLVRQEFAEAEDLLRRYLDIERKKGPLHRPELRDHWLELGESLFGQGKHDDAFAALREARAIGADFNLPGSPAWRSAMASWLTRARQLARTDDAAALEQETERLSTTADQVTAISARLSRPPALR